MEIREAKSKGRASANEDTRRLVVLGKDRVRYKVFRYPMKARHDSVGGEDILMS